MPHPFFTNGMQFDPAKDTVTEGTRARCAWVVESGIIPAQPEPEFTKRWVLTSESWEKELEESKPIREMPDEEYKKWLADGNHYESTFQKFQNAAMVYAQSLQNPQATNWVRLDWIWF